MTQHTNQPTTSTTSASIFNHAQGECPTRYNVPVQQPISNLPLGNDLSCQDWLYDCPYTPTHKTPYPQNNSPTAATAIVSAIPQCTVPPPSPVSLFILSSSISIVNDVVTFESFHYLHSNHYYIFYTPNITSTTTLLFSVIDHPSFNSAFVRE